MVIKQAPERHGRHDEGIGISRLQHRLLANVRRDDNVARKYLMSNTLAGHAKSHGESNEGTVGLGRKTGIPGHAESPELAKKAGGRGVPAGALSRVGGGVGCVLMVVSTSALVAAGMGVDTVRAKSMVFAIAAALSGLSGALLALYLRSFNASAFGVGLSIELLMMVILGSLSTVWGAIFGAFAIIVLPNLLEGFDHAKHLIYGIVMVGIMMFAHRGLGETLFRLVTRERSVEGA